MKGSAIRELAASGSSTTIAAGFFNKTIQVWDVKSQKKICEFATIFQMGARNLALSPDGGLLVAGLSRGLGAVVANEIPSGKKLWQRKRLNYPSLLLFDPTGKSIFCTVNDRRSVLRLELSTGMTIEDIGGISQQIEGAFANTLIVPSEKSKKPYRLTAGDHSFDVGAFSYAVLDAAFSPHSVCLTEVGGPVRCISCEDGKLQWAFDPGKESLVLRMHYSPRLDAFFGVMRNLNNKHNRRLLRLDVASGVCEQLCDLDYDAWDAAFIETTDQLVTTSGEIRNLSDGALTGRLAFPKKEYPADE